MILVSYGGVSSMKSKGDHPIIRRIKKERRLLCSKIEQLGQYIV